MYRERDRAVRSVALELRRRRPVDEQPVAVALRVELLVQEEGPVGALVETFGTESYSDFSAKWSNFRGLVLFCIGTDLCK